jgi:predicted nicotinamide N-methyase
VDLLEEVVPLPGRELVVLRPRDTEALLTDEALGQDELMPYWAELWPSGVALARAVWSAPPRRGRRVLELGCGGLALPSIASALRGARVTASDWAPDAIGLARENAARNGAAVEVVQAAWGSPEPLVSRAPWDLVLAADVLYERRNLPILLDLLPRLGDEAWIADPGRPRLGEFLDAAAETWEVDEVRDPAVPAVVVHRLRLRR